jgi:hypothetical protein
MAARRSLARFRFFRIGESVAMHLIKRITIAAVFIWAAMFSACGQNQEEKAAERYRDLVKSSTGKTISVNEATEMLKKLENDKIVKSDEIEQTLNLLKAKYDYKIFPPQELQGKMIFTFILKDYLLKDDMNVLFVGQLDDITNEDGQFSIHLFSQLHSADGRSRKRVHFNLRCTPESIEAIINNPPDEPRVFAGFQKHYFVICKITELFKVASYSQFNSDNERAGLEVFLDALNEYQVEGDLVEIIPHPK